ncbi:MAG: methyltransferase domain-containing protein [Planctomycetaceae bacterium]|nr:methyltransferase domain-containing protein [Planctomycetaceae bacterium]
MTNTDAYQTDLAYIHDTGYGNFARKSAPGLLRHFQEAGIHDGYIVDLGCGSGIWAKELVDAGYDVVGVDISSAMIEIAHQRVPKAKFHVASFLQFPIPSCRAVTALGEVFNYLFDSGNSLLALKTVCENIFHALSPGGLLIFDVAVPDRFQGQSQAFTEGENWACLVEYEHNQSKQQLTRRIVTFRKIGKNYRRQEEIHRQQLFDEPEINAMLKGIGFHTQSVQAYGDFPLIKGLIGFIASKP